jgi:hypothetical protein
VCLYIIFGEPKHATTTVMKKAESKKYILSVHGVTKVTAR